MLKGETITRERVVEEIEAGPILLIARLVVILDNPMAIPDNLQTPAALVLSPTNLGNNSPMAEALPLKVWASIRSLNPSYLHGTRIIIKDNKANPVLCVNFVISRVMVQKHVALGVNLSLAFLGLKLIMPMRTRAMATIIGC